MTSALLTYLAVDAVLSIVTLAVGVYVFKKRGTYIKYRLQAWLQVPSHYQIANTAREALAYHESDFHEEELARREEAARIERENELAAEADFNDEDDFDYDEEGSEA